MAARRNARWLLRAPALAEVALEAIADAKGKVAEETRRQLELDRDALIDADACGAFEERQRLKRAAIAAQRDAAVRVA